LWLDFEGEKLPRLRDPTMVVAVSTSVPQYRALYSQARELGEYLLKTLQFERIATVRSSAFPPEVLVNDDGISALPACYLYLRRGKKDLVLFAGDASPMEDQYEFAHFLLKRAADLGVRELYSVGARWAENPLPPEAEPVPNGFATDAVGVAKLKKAGVVIIKEEPAPFFASMVVALSKEYGIRGYKLSVDHGEPIPHARSVAKLLGALSSMTGFDVPLEGLGVKPGRPTPQRQPGDATIYH
jgi:proteasome assembly chaperone (PAC2) family protein